MDTAALILIAVVAVPVVVVALLLLPQLREKKRSRDLRNRFGPEYCSLGLCWLPSACVYAALRRATTSR